jgi:RNA polymerase sigma factor (sigma-70 family)
MADRALRSLVDYLRRLTGGGDDPSSDGQLLERFALEQDEAAFAVLVQRHGPLVWGVCRRLLHNEQDVEDAFQATFLVLVRKANSVRKRGSVGSWLYGVARRVAARARQRAELRREKEGRVSATPSAEPAEGAQWEEVRPLLDEEIGRLPEKYRLPVILCYLDGRTNEEAARQLGCPKGTIATRLAWARERLRSRLSRRGVTLSAGALAVLLSDKLSPAAVPAALAAATLRGAVQFALGNAAGGGVSAAAVALMKGVVRAMFLSKVKAVGTAVLAVAVVAGGGAGMFTYVGRAQVPADPAQPPSKDKGVVSQAQPPAKDKELAAKFKEKLEAVLGNELREARAELAKIPQKQLKEVLQARREAAEEMVNARIQEFLAGRISLDLVVEAQRLLLKAELEVSEKKEDRMRALERYLEFKVLLHQVNKARYEARKIGPADYAESNYSLQEAEIELLREKAR